MERASNDATLTKMGDIYQYFIALLDCFEMIDGDIMQIEVNGDVSKISKNAFSFQKEVKHHIGNGKLIDRDIDFWKTLKNWFLEFERIESFKTLILFTTVEILDDSPFCNWNSKAPDEKLLNLMAIGEVKKEREETFRKLYDVIFEKSKDRERKLNSILFRFEIHSQQPQITGISQSFNRHVKHIPIANRDSYIAAMLGNILSKVKDKPHIWEVTYKDFELLLQQESARYINPSTVPLPIEFALVSPPEGTTNAHQDKAFVKAIRAIKYEKEVPAAIVNYWRMQMTVINYFRDNPVYNRSLPQYKDDLCSKLHYVKEQKCIDYSESERSIQIKESKKVYGEAMSWDAHDFGSISPNMLFFQKGVIHDIVEDEKFCWDIGEEDEH